VKPTILPEDAVYAQKEDWRVVVTPLCVVLW